MAQFLDSIPAVKDIFLDVDAIELGENFERKIRQTLSKSTHCFVLMGPEWAGTQNTEGRSRLFDPEDFVRQESRLALESGAKTIPILLDGATMPKATDLPEDLKSLPKINAFMLRTSHFDEDMDDLLDAVIGGKKGRGSRWRRGKLTALGIVGRLLGGLAAAAVIVFAAAVANDVVSQGACSLTCRVQETFGFASQSAALGPMLSLIAMVFVAGALVPFLPRLLSRKR